MVPVLFAFPSQRKYVRSEALGLSDPSTSRSFPSLARRTHGRAAELNMAAFLLACIVNVQYVSLQLFKHGQKAWSRVQATVTPPSPTNSNVAPKDPLSFPFFVKKLLYLLLYIVHSLQYKVLKCPTKININVTVAGVFSTIDPCHS